jgi:hypothetical protein
MSALRDENLSWGQEVTPRQTRQFSTFLLPLLYRCLLGCVEQAVRPLPSPTVREAAERTGSSHRCLPRPRRPTLVAYGRCPAERCIPSLHPPLLVAVFVG